MHISEQEAVTKMGHYLNFLASKVNQGDEPLHVKQAGINRLTKLSAALHETKDLMQALKIAYPQQGESWRLKIAMGLVNGLAAKMRKAANFGTMAKSVGRAAGAGLGQMQQMAGQAARAPQMHEAAPGFGGAPALPPKPMAQPIGAAAGGRGAATPAQVGGDFWSAGGGGAAGGGGMGGGMPTRSIAPQMK